MNSRVAIVKGKNRKEGIKSALKLVEEDIERAIKRKKSRTLFIKANVIDINFPLAITHPDALEAVLEFFNENFKESFDQILVGDNSFAFKEKGLATPYDYLTKRFPGLEFSALEGFDSKKLTAKHFTGRKKTIRVSLFPKKAFTVSLSLPKTHDTFVYTGAVKNMFGCVTKNRGFVHALRLRERVFLKRFVKSNKAKNENMVKALSEVMPDLAVLDGWEAMEGNGPIFGTAIEFCAAVASVDAIAVDSLFRELMGLPETVYLEMLSAKGFGATNKEEVELLKQGFSDLRELEKKVEPHYLTEYMVLPWNSRISPLAIDWPLAKGLMKRSYRLKDKAIEWLKERIQG